jgi:hypothetical protein
MDSIPISLDLIRVIIIYVRFYYIIHYGPGKLPPEHYRQRTTLHIPNMLTEFRPCWSQDQQRLKYK